MQLYLILSHLNSSFVFIFDPPVRPSDPDHGGIPARVVRRGGTHTTMIIITMGEMGGGRRLLFPFTPYRPTRKVPSPLPNTAIVVVVVMMEVAAVAVVGFSTLASLARAFPRYRPSAYTSSLRQ